MFEKSLKARRWYKNEINFWKAGKGTSCQVAIPAVKFIKIPENTHSDLCRQIIGQQYVYAKLTVALDSDMFKSGQYIWEITTDVVVVVVESLSCKLNNDVIIPIRILPITNENSNVLERRKPF